MAKVIRRVSIADAPSIQAIYAPFVSDESTSFEVVVPEAVEIERRILGLAGSHPWLVFEEDGITRGYAYASPHRARLAYQWCVEVSVYVEPSAHRRGIGRALYTALFDLLRRQGFVNAYAGITLPNASSVGLHESLGFVPVGIYRRIGFKFGRWHDVEWLQLRLRDDEAEPPDLRSTGDVWKDPSVQAVLNACAASVADAPVS